MRIGRIQRKGGQEGRFWDLGKVRESKERERERERERKMKACESAMLLSRFFAKARIYFTEQREERKKTSGEESNPRALRQTIPVMNRKEDIRRFY